VSNKIERLRITGIVFGIAALVLIILSHLFEGSVALAAVRFALIAAVVGIYGSAVILIRRAKGEAVLATITIIMWIIILVLDVFDLAALL